MHDPVGGDPPPDPPAPPSAEDCCQGGCTRCVFDVHDEAMERHRARLEAWRNRRGISDTGDE